MSKENSASSPSTNKDLDKNKTSQKFIRIPCLRCKRVYRKWDDPRRKNVKSTQYCRECYTNRPRPDTVRKNENDAALLEDGDKIRLYDKHIKPLEEIDDLDFELLHQSMLKAKWDYFDSLPKDKAAEFMPALSKQKEDFYRELLEMNKDILASCGLSFQRFYEKVDSALRNLPIGGGILLDPTYSKIILVQIATSGKYDLPKGKVDPGESIRDAAIRNIEYRTGYSAVLDEEPPIEGRHNERLTTLFYVPNVPIDFAFSPRYDKVVSSVEFFDLDKINSNGFYGYNKYDKRVTYLVTSHLRDIKTYCRKMKIVNGDLL